MFQFSLTSLSFLLVLTLRIPPLFLPARTRFGLGCIHSEFISVIHQCSCRRSKDRNVLLLLSQIKLLPFYMYVNLLNSILVYMYIHTFLSMGLGPLKTFLHYSCGRIMRTCCYYMECGVRMLNMQGIHEWKFSTLFIYIVDCTMECVCASVCMYCIYVCMCVSINTVVCSLTHTEYIDQLRLCRCP